MPVITVALKEGKSYRSPKYNNLAITDKPHKMTVTQAMCETMKADGLLVVNVLEDDAPPKAPAVAKQAAPAQKPAAGKPGAPKVPAGNPLAPKPKPAAKPAAEDSESNGEE